MSHDIEKEQCQIKNIKVVEKLNQFSFDNDKYLECEKGNRHSPAPRFGKGIPVKMKLEYETTYRNNMCSGCIKCYSADMQTRLITEDFNNRMKTFKRHMEEKEKELITAYQERLAEVVE